MVDYTTLAHPITKPHFSRAVINDVTRLLYLLNKTRSKVKMPVDGVELMRWSEKILKRYLASQVLIISYITTE